MWNEQSFQSPNQMRSWRFQRFRHPDTPDPGLTSNRIDTQRRTQRGLVVTGWKKRIHGLPKKQMLGEPTGPDFGMHQQCPHEILARRTQCVLRGEQHREPRPLGSRVFKQPLRETLCKRIGTTAGTARGRDVPDAQLRPKSGGDAFAAQNPARRLIPLLVAEKYPTEVRTRTLDPALNIRDKTWCRGKSQNSLGRQFRDCG
jgi:hypothetical protein